MTCLAQDQYLVTKEMYHVPQPGGMRVAIGGTPHYDH